MDINLLQTELNRVKTETHEHCIVCGSANDSGLHLQFALTDDGGVQAEFDCRRAYESYRNTLHGGIIALLLDGAMTNCLFAHGRSAVTGDLRIRFRHPVTTDRPVTVSSRVERSSPPLHVMHAEIVQDGVVMAVGTGKFMERAIA